MQIEITSADQFDSLLNALAGEVTDAEFFFRLHMDLLAAVPEYEEVFNESRAFWSLTLQATLDAALSRLCRAYDQHSESLNLRNLLDTIDANLDIFNTDNFRERLQDSPFVESLAQTESKPDTHVLSRDMQSVSSNDPLVKKLVIWRNNIIAHRSASNVVNEKDITKDYPLTETEVSELVTRATSILNRYSSLFRASTYSPIIVGHDDYLYVLKSIKENIRRYREEIDAEVTRLTQADGMNETGEVA